MPSKRGTTPELEAAARKLLADGTYGKPAPLVDKMTSFAHTVVVFLEDFRDGRLTSDEVCDTLLAAAISRNFVKPTNKPAKKLSLIDILTNVQVRSFTNEHAEKKP
jgi:hypothetical protein